MESQPPPLLALFGRALVLAVLVGLAAGALLTWARLAGLESSSPALMWRTAMARTNAATLAALVALLAWLALFAATARVTRDERLRGLLATALVATPGALWLGLWVNRHLLPDLVSIQSLLGNLSLGVGLVAATFFVAARLRGWRRRAERGAGLSLAVLALPLALNLVGLRSTPPGPSALVILIDVLGADHMSCYGYERVTTPHLDRLAEDAVLFEQAVAQSSFTKTSVASLFTARWPHRHGVYVGSLKDTAGHITSDVLGPHLDTLAEGLQRAGYHTAGWVANDQLQPWMGFDQGFGLYDDDPGNVTLMSRAFEGWLEEWGDEPYFAYLHLMDLHGPYRPLPPYDEKFGRHADMEPFEWPAWNEYKRSVRLGVHVPAAAEVEQLRAWYDGQLAWVDEQLGRTLERLRESGRYDETLIVVVADHGDAFMQHGFVSHSHTPFEELIHVPLIVKLPHSRNGGRRVTEQVALVDLGPTLEELLGAEPRAPGAVDGASLAGLLDAGGAPEREWIFSEYKDRVAVRSGRWKFIHTGRGQRLFDLAADPGETVDVLASHPELAEELAELVRASFVERERGKGARIELDDETVRSLTELGYM